MTSRLRRLLQKQATFVACEWKFQRSTWKAQRRACNTESTRNVINKDKSLHPNALSNALQAAEQHATPHLFLAQLEQLIAAEFSPGNILALARRLYRSIGQGLVPDAFIKSLSSRGSRSLRDSSGLRAPLVDRC